MHFSGLVVALVVVPDGKPDIAHQSDQHQYTLPEDDLAGHAEPNIDKRCGGHAEKVALDGPRVHRNRGDYGGDAQNKQDVGDIAADHVADGKAR